MTDADQELLRQEAAYLGPVVQASRKLLDAMEPLPLCAVCPAAQWYRIEDDQRTPRLEAFCTAFRGVMYDHRRRAVTACDGRTDTIEGGTKARPGPA